MSANDDVVRIAMWSGPRNISTAMMRAWENRADTVVWDEPLYAFFLSTSGIVHPMNEEVIAAGEPDWCTVVEQILGPLPAGNTVYFQKHMTHHLLPQVDRTWMTKVHNCFLIRDPREVVASYVKARAEFTLEDIGVIQQAEIYDHVASNSDEAPVVLDGKDVLSNPAGILSRWCERLGIAFSERMLSWPPGLRDSDGVWAAHWYANVEHSTGFQPYVKKGFDLPTELEPLVEECMPHYRRLHERRLVVD